MKIRIGFVFIALFFLTSCATSMKYTWTKENVEGKKYDKVLVLTVTKNLKTRTLFENTVVNLLAKEGINATNAISVFSPFEKMNELSETDIENIIKDGKYDAILVTTLMDINMRDIRINSYDPYMYGGRYGYGFGSFIYNCYDYMYNDQFREEKTYVLETRLYGVEETNPKQAIVWSCQSELVDPWEVESVSKSYSKELVKTLMESGTIGK